MNAKAETDAIAPAGEARWRIPDAAHWDAEPVGQHRIQHG